MTGGKTNIVVIGGKGKLGAAIVAEADLDSDVHVKAVVDRQGSLKASTKKGDVIVDASNWESVETNLRLASEVGAAYVLAVTGYPESLQKNIKEFGKKFPIVVAPNLCVGVAVLRELTHLAVSLLEGIDVEIVEAHHKHKKDVPSGTALSLASALNKKVPIHSLRGGDVIGEHQVRFMMNGEQIQLTHSASDRSVFAKGALRAAKFVGHAKPGVYSMRDVLGLK